MDCLTLYSTGNTRNSATSVGSADVPQDIITAFLRSLPDICTTYDLEGIFKVEKGDLFHRQIQTKSLVKHDDPCKDSKTIGTKMYHHPLWLFCHG